MTYLDSLTLDDARFSEIPGLRGLRIARLGQADGKTLEVVEAQRGVVIQQLTHPSKESGRILKGSVRFMQDGVLKVLHAGDTWTVEAGRAQGPHVILEDDTRIALLREGKSALDTV